MSENINSKRLNTKQAAEYLGLAEQSLHNRRHLRLQPDYIKIGKSVRYDTQDLDKFIESNRIKLSAQEDTMKSILSKAKRKAIVFLLPWIATIITYLPCWNWSSRLIDRLIVVSEGN